MKIEFINQMIPFNSAMQCGKLFRGTRVCIDYKLCVFRVAPTCTKLRLRAFFFDLTDCVGRLISIHCTFYSRYDGEVIAGVDDVCPEHANSVVRPCTDKVYYERRYAQSFEHHIF